MAYVQDSLLALGDLELRSDARFDRIHLDERCWVDQSFGWLSGQMQLYDRLAGSSVWSQRSRPMYSELVLEPRLTTGVRPGDRRLPALITRMSGVLGEIYGQRLDSIWLNWYRDGDDSVAWHSDRIGRSYSDPLVAIVSLGAPRKFLMRPKVRGVDSGSPRRSIAFEPGGGDLLVMGGASQHDWEHAVPKATGAGPRMSLTFRPSKQ